MMTIVLNPFAAGGKAGKRWDLIKNEISEPYKLINLAKTQHLQLQVREAYQSGSRQFVAAGGDGTVNLVLQTVLETFEDFELKEIILGAIGIGSSNDYHKPKKQAFNLKKYPHKICTKNIIIRDVLKLELSTTDKKQFQRYALLNASCGLTAKGNQIFNQSILKKLSTNLAILFAVFRSIFSFRNYPIKVTENQKVQKFNITNIGIIKSPFFTGELAYNSQFVPDSGQYSLYICHDMNRWDVLKMLWGFKMHRFSLGKRSRCISLDEGDIVTLSSKSSIPFEFDGEIESFKFVKISMMKQKIRCSEV